MQDTKAIDERIADAASNTSLAEDLAPATGDYDYDGALRLIRSIQRAMVDRDYYFDALNYLVANHRAEFAVKFIAAVGEQARFAALDAELAGELDRSAV